MRPTLALPATRARFVSSLVAAASLWGTRLPALADDSGPPDTVKMEGLRGGGKSTVYFPDFEKTSSGLQYKEFKPGEGGRKPKAGDGVVVDWTGVTIGYQGRYFQTRNKPKGGAFADSGFETDYLRFNVGDGSVIPAIDE